MNDPFFKQKTDLLGEEMMKRTYRCMADLSEDGTYKCLSFLRFCEFDGDMMILAAAKMRDEKTRQRGGDTDSDDEIKSYKAENLSVLSVVNERRVLVKVKALAEEGLKQYP